MRTYGIERVALRRKLRKTQAEAGDIVLVCGDESEAPGASESGAGLA
jgi:hypothetical protein